MAVFFENTLKYCIETSNASIYNLDDQMYLIMNCFIRATANDALILSALILLVMIIHEIIPENAQIDRFFNLN